MLLLHAVVMFLLSVESTAWEKALISPVIRSQREPVSPTLSGELPRRALTSGLLRSHSGPAAASGTPPIWVAPSSGRCLCQPGAECLDPTTPQVWGCRWCIDRVKSHCGKSSALQGDSCWAPAPCLGGRQTLQTSHQCVWSGSSGPAHSAHCGSPLALCGQVHAEMDPSLLMAAAHGKQTHHASHLVLISNNFFFIRDHIHFLVPWASAMNILLKWLHLW